MILAGIDMGVETTKAVILEDGAVIGRSKTPSGGIDRPVQARRAYEAALADAGVEAEAVEAVSATGKGKYDVAFAGRRVTETIAAAHGARLLCPDATCVVSAGADETLAATLGAERLVGEYALNQKCAAGLGTFLRTVAERLGLSLDALGGVETEGGADVNEGCVVFAELDALSMLNGGASPEAVAGVCVRAAAVRAASVVNDLTVPANDRVVLVGGLAKNGAFVRALERVLGFPLAVPGDAEYALAIGAAISGVKGIGL